MRRRNTRVQVTFYASCIGKNESPHKNSKKPENLSILFKYLHPTNIKGTSENSFLEVPLSNRPLSNWCAGIVLIFFTKQFQFGL